jgi:hypothetical protein
MTLKGEPHIYKNRFIPLDLYSLPSKRKFYNPVRFNYRTMLAIISYTKMFAPNKVESGKLSVRAV